MITRIHALTNTFSGVAGEARIAAELVRCGLRAAKPYWTDNEVDLIVLHHDGATVVPIPVQVKSVQFLPSESRAWNADRFLTGIKKRYVSQNAALCLAIYRPDRDKIWFVDGAANIEALYDADAGAAERAVFATLADGDDVRIRVREADAAFDQAWEVPRGDAAWLPARIKRIADDLIQHGRLIAQLETLWNE